MIMSFSKKLACGLCSKKVIIQDENFPEDLYDLLSKYSIPRLYWICKCCDKKYLDNDHGEIFSLKDDMKLLKIRVENLEIDVSKITGCSRYKAPDYEAVNSFEESSYEVSGVLSSYEVSGVFTSDSGQQDSLPDYYSSPISPNYGRASSPTSSGSYSRTPHSINKNFLLEDASPKKSHKEALAILDKILKTKIKIDAKESEKSSNVVTRFLNHITPALKKDVVFRSMYSRDYKTGSSYNELRISEASEYDVEIVLKAPPQIRLEVEFFKETMRFAKLKWKKTDSSSSKVEILDFFVKNSENGYLKPLKLSAWFQGLIDVYLKSDPKIPGIRKMINSQSGPARTIKIVTDEGYELSIDLLLAFTFSYDCLMGTKTNEKLEKYPVHKSKKFWFLVPKTCKGEVPLLAPDCPFSWGVDFPEVEKKVLYNKICAKNVVKLLKLLRDQLNWQMIKSYHLKTLILWAIEANPETDYWLGSFLFDRYLEALDSLQKFLEKQFLPYFLDDTYNLFHELNKDECINLSNCLKNIIKHIKSDYGYLNSIYS